jgi:3-hydroxyisobutyrate dehydrogenase-like beta-hydroxyacid dehydrogenase
MVTEDAAAQYVWLDAEHGAIAGLSKDAIAIESSTVEPAWIAQQAGAALPVTSRVRDQFAAAQVKALGGSHITAVAKLFN